MVNKEIQKSKFALRWWIIAYLLNFLDITSRYFTTRGEFSARLMNKSIFSYLSLGSDSRNAVRFIQSWRLSLLNPPCVRIKRFASEWISLIGSSGFSSSESFFNNCESYSSWVRFNFSIRIWCDFSPSWIRWDPGLICVPNAFQVLLNEGLELPVRKTKAA